MPRSKKYEPHCPEGCAGGRAGRLHQVMAENVKVPPEILSRKRPSDVIYRCSYCGFVWFQRSSSYPGYDPTPAGFYNDFRNPETFSPVPEDYRIREENTPIYWDRKREEYKKRREQLKKIRLKKR
jgi:hypothetical protein